MQHEMKWQFQVAIMNKLVAVRIVVLIVSLIFWYWGLGFLSGIRGMGTLALGFGAHFGFITGLVLIIWGLASKTKQ